MATTTISVAKNTWAPIATGPLRVSFSGTHGLYFCATSGPTPGPGIVGYFSGEHETQSVDLPSGETLYARSETDAMRISYDTESLA